MEAIADPPEEALGRGDRLGLASDQDTKTHQSAPNPEPRVAAPLDDPVARACRPPDSVEVPKASGRALHIRLQKVQRSAEAFVTGCRFGLEAIDERVQAVLSKKALARGDQQST